MFWVEFFWCKPLFWLGYFQEASMKTLENYLWTSLLNRKWHSTASLHRNGEIVDLWWESVWPMASNSSSSSNSKAAAAAAYSLGPNANSVVLGKRRGEERTNVSSLFIPTIATFPSSAKASRYHSIASKLLHYCSRVVLRGRPTGRLTDWLLVCTT